MSDDHPADDSDGGQDADETPADEGRLPGAPPEPAEVESVGGGGDPSHNDVLFSRPTYHRGNSPAFRHPRGVARRGPTCNRDGCRGVLYSPDDPDIRMSCDSCHYEIPDLTRGGEEDGDEIVPGEDE